MRRTRGDTGFLRRLPAADRVCAVPDFALCEGAVLLPATFFAPVVDLLPGLEEGFEAFAFPD